jgi:hypothetical protein
MAAKPYTFKLSAEADFSAFVKNAQRASKKINDTLAEAVEKGLGGANYRVVQKKLEGIVRAEAEARKRLEIRNERRRAEAEGRLASLREDEETRIAKVRDQLTQKTVDRETRLRLEAEEKIAAERLKIFGESTEAFEEALTEGFEDLAHFGREFKKLENSTAKTAAYYGRTADRLGKMSKFFRGELTDGAADAVDTLTDGLEGVIGRLTSGVDLGNVSRGLGKGLGKGLGHVGDLVGGLGKAGPALALVATGLGTVVASLGMFLGVMFEADKKVKEFNKSALNTFGALELARVGAGDLNAGLRVINHTVTDLTGTLGLTQDEALGVFDALDRGGFTLDRITKRTDDAVLAQKLLTDNLRELSRVARASGTGMSEYVSQLTEYVDSLGASLGTVNDSFAAISDMAARSSFGTRRFYSMVVQATAGQASLNTRLEDTADLLLRMTKVLGSKKAAEMVGEHAADLQSMSTQDRYRMILTSGSGRVRQTLGSEAGHQARSFAQEASKNLGAVRGALGEAGLGGSLAGSVQRAGGDRFDASATQDLVRQLQSMTRAQQDQFVAALQSRDAGLGRQVNQLITVTRGAQGGMSAMADAMSGVSAGGSIVMKLRSAMAVLGKPLNELTGVERMAAEQITGTSGAQFEALKNVAQNAEGQYGILRRIATSGQPLSAATQAELAKRFGATVVDGQIKVARTNREGTAIEAFGETVTDSTQLISAYMERSGDTLDNIRSEQTQLQYDTFDATVSVADILENKILYYIRAIYEDVGQPIIEWLSKTMGLGTEDQRRAAREGREAIGAAIFREQSTISSSTRTLAKKRDALGSTSDLSKRTQLQQEIDALQKQLDTSRARVETLTTTRSQLAGGDYSSLARQDTWTAEGGGTYNTLDAALADARKRTSTGSALLGVLTAGELGGGPSVQRGERYGLRPDLLAGVRPTSSTGGAPPTRAAPVTLQATSIDPNPTATASTTSAIQTNAETVVAATREASTAAATRHQEGQRTLGRVLTRETKLGDALARSRLPEAIAEAQMREQFMAEAFASGLNPQQVSAAAEAFFGQGTLTDDLRTHLATGAGTPEGLASLRRLGIRPEDLTAGGRTLRIPRAAAGGAATEGGGEGDFPDGLGGIEGRGVHDFIYRGDGVRGQITPIDTADQFIGMRPGGPVERGAQRDGGTVNVHIHGGNLNEVYGTVRRVLLELGVAPSQVRPRV